VNKLVKYSDQHGDCFVPNHFLLIICAGHFTGMSCGSVVICPNSFLSFDVISTASRQRHAVLSFGQAAALRTLLMILRLVIVNIKCEFEDHAHNYCDTKL
jgi:hypothetical protein